MANGAADLLERHFRGDRRRDQGLCSWSAGVGRRYDRPQSARYVLLYGTSLFRQSRHYTSFLSRESRGARTGSTPTGSTTICCATLKSSASCALSTRRRAFYRKPGGFAWLYRDVQLASRTVTEALSKPAHQRSRAARWISVADAPFPAGDWYLRAFSVSGHANPLMEAAYHFYQSILHAPFAVGRSKSKTAVRDAQQRRRLHAMGMWRRALRQLVSTLRRGPASISILVRHRRLRAWFDKVPSRRVGGGRGGRRRRPCPRR